MATPSWIIGMGKDADMSADARGQRLFSFWIPQGKSKEIIFLTDGNEAPAIWEHQVAFRKKGKLDWNNFFTCLQTANMRCPLCDYAEEYAKSYRAKVQLFAVLDLTPWKDKKDVEHKYSRQILRAKKATSEILIRKYCDRLDEQQTLRGAQFKVFRGNSDKSANVGDDFTFKKMVNLSAFPPEDVVGLDLEMFAPSREAVKRAVERLTSSFRGDSSYDEPTVTHDADVPLDDVVVNYGE